MDERNRKISEALKRYYSTPRGEEHRRKMSEGMRRFWGRVRQSGKGQA